MPAAAATRPRSGRLGRSGPIEACPFHAVLVVPTPCRGGIPSHGIALRVGLTWFRTGSRFMPRQCTNRIRDGSGSTVHELRCDQTTNENGGGSPALAARG